MAWRMAGWGELNDGIGRTTLQLAAMVNFSLDFCLMVSLFSERCLEVCFSGCCSLLGGLLYGLLISGTFLARCSAAVHT